jgi:hypothetical protein
VSTSRFTVRRLLAALALLVTIPTALAASAGTAAAEPAPGTCPATVVRSAEVVRSTSGPRLLVSGIAQHPDAFLRLEAEKIDFVQQPDYWNYSVVACGGTGPIVKSPYTQSFPVPSYPVGKFGINVGGIIVDLFPGGPVTM